MIRNFALSVFLLLPIFTSSQEHGPAKATPADAIYIHAKIYTGVVGMSSTQEIKRAQALAIRGERIVAVGSNEEVLQQKGPATTVIDLQGHFAMPGFNDAHMHLADAGFKQLTVDLTGTRSLAEFQQRIRQHVGSARPGEWITGSGWDETLWQVKKLPTRADIDKVAAGHPVYVERIDGHVSVVNTLALKIAKVTEASQAPAGGEIGRDPSGQPNAYFFLPTNGNAGDPAFPLL